MMTGGARHLKLCLTARRNLRMRAQNTWTSKKKTFRKNNCTLVKIIRLLTIGSKEIRVMCHILECSNKWHRILSTTRETTLLLTRPIWTSSPRLNITSRSPRSTSQRSIRSRGGRKKSSKLDKWTMGKNSKDCSQEKTIRLLHCCSSSTLSSTCRTKDISMFWWRPFMELWRQSGTI